MALKYEDIVADMSTVGYALTMLPKWVDLLAAGEMSTEGAVRAARQDLAAAVPAFERLRVKLYELEA